MSKIQPFLPESWRSVLRLAWILLALNAVFTFAGTMFYTWELSAFPSADMAQGFIEAGITPNLYFGINAAVQSINFFSYLVIASLVFWRMPNDPMALFIAVFFIGFGASSAYPPTPEFLRIFETGHVAYVTAYMVNNFLGFPFLVAFFALYPDGKFVPRWMVLSAIYGFLVSLGWTLFPEEFGEPTGWFAAFVVISVIFVFGSSLYAQVNRYRNHSNDLQRHQTKWMVYGFSVTVAAIIAQEVTTIVFITRDNSSGLNVWRDLIAAVSYLFLAAVPIAVGIAILRYRLYDIDLVIRRTLQYAMLTGLLALAYFGGVVVLQGVLGPLSGQADSPLVAVLTTLGVAALFNPLRRRIQDFIDRRFYRQKYDAEKALAEFAAAARSETDLEQLSTHLTKNLQKALQPERIALWLMPNTKSQDSTYHSQRDS